MIEMTSSSNNHQVQKESWFVLALAVRLTTAQTKLEQRRMATIIPYMRQRKCKKAMMSKGEWRHEIFFSKGNEKRA
jgi:hypothetical protein